MNTNYKNSKSRAIIIICLVLAVAVLAVICIRQNVYIKELREQIAGLNDEISTGETAKNFPADMAAADYPVQGVDVSSYQGNIDWQVLARQNLSFAFIKATEGSSYTDSKFEENLKGALETDLRVGAYHFFSYDSSGATQAENFINTVPKNDDMLPPVIDVEFYGQYEDDKSALPDSESVKAELHTLVDMLTDHYGKKPIIYANDHSYSLFIAGEFDYCDIWISSTTVNPLYLVDRRWTFWQYNVAAQLEGYGNSGDHIDLNVFFGTKEQFAEYAR